MNKEFITYQEALALKELGFDEPCIAFYEPNNEKVMIVGIPQRYNDPSLLYVTDFCAPLYQQAFRFLYKELGRDGFGVMPIDIDKCNKELNRLIEIVKEK